MRRMYSEKELSVLVYQAVGQYIEDGALDESIADAVDAYLVENPVDITALEGQDIAPKDISATGNITAPSIIENMSGYSIIKQSAPTGATYDKVYFGACKNGNKLTFVVAMNITLTEAITSTSRVIAQILIPSAIGSKLYPTLIGSDNFLDMKEVALVKDYADMEICPVSLYKDSNTRLYLNLYNWSQLDINKQYYFRYEVTFLLGDDIEP